jgi:crotonobetainyl-CoA:carnitine CoA-transferase CaiB-like acyl-CoA transferase
MEPHPVAVHPSPSSPPLPCAGVRVLDFTRGPLAITTMILADYGADVVRVEAPAGDTFRRMPAYRQWNRGKRALVADLDDPSSLATVRSLASGCDVIVENFRPGVADRLGVGYQALSADNPGLVYLAVTGFGPSGRYANYKAYEGIVAAKCGQHLIQNGYRSDGPIYDAVFKSSFGAAMLGVIGVLAALHAREVHGVGQEVHTSMVQGTAVYSYSGLRAPDPTTTASMSLVQGRDPHNVLPGYRIARCADGQWIQSGSYGPGIFENLMRGLGIDEYFTDPRFAKGVWTLDEEDRAALTDLVDQAYLTKTLDEWIAVLHDHDAAFGEFHTTQEFMSYPQVVHNSHVVDVPDPIVGPMRQVGPLATFGCGPWTWPGPAPDPRHRTTPAHGPQWRPRPTGVPQPRMAGAAGPAPIGATRHAALEDVTVVDLAMWAAAPGGPGLLADLGARVIKVEPPQGDPTSRTGGELFVRMTRSKRRVAIDLKAPEGQAALHALVARADIVVHNFRPGVPERLGCDFETLAAVNQRLVYVYAAAFGSTGPDARRPAFDPVISAMAGGEILQAGRGNPPQQRQTADHSALLGVGAAMLLGLRNRNRTGQAQYVETTMLASAAYLFSDDFLSYEGKPERPVPDGGQHGLGALYRLYRASDGWVFLACMNQEEWRRLCHVMDPALHDDPQFARPWEPSVDEALADALAGRFAQRPSADWEQRLQAADVACVVADRSWPYLLFDEEGALAPGMVVEQEVPGVGLVRQPGPSIDLSATPGQLGQLEVLGQSTAAVLMDAGLTADWIDELAARGVVRLAG